MVEVFEGQNVSKNVFEKNYEINWDRVYDILELDRY